MRTLSQSLRGGRNVPLQYRSRQAKKPAVLKRRQSSVGFHLGPQRFDWSKLAFILAFIGIAVAGWLIGAYLMVEAFRAVG